MRYLLLTMIIACSSAAQSDPEVNPVDAGSDAQPGEGLGGSVSPGLGGSLGSGGSTGRGGATGKGGAPGSGGAAPADSPPTCSIVTGWSSVLGNCDNFVCHLCGGTVGGVQYLQWSACDYLGNPVSATCKVELPPATDKLDECVWKACP